MKQSFLLRPLQNAAKRIPMGLGLALAVSLLHLNATAQEVNLGTANNFAVLAYSAISSAGGTASVINGGNVGLYPDGASSITGPIAITTPYTTYAADPGGVALKAQNDLTTAYNQAAGLTPTSAHDYTTYNGGNLGGLTLTPGVYFFSSSAQLTGTLTLIHNQDDPDAVFVFQIGTSTLITAANSSVVEEGITPTGGIIPDANPGMSVFWQVGSSATLGADTTFEGNILAQVSISDDGGSTVYGRLLAETGAVSLGSTTVNTPPAEVPAVVGGGGGEGVPDTGSTLLLLGSALAALFAFARRFSLLGRMPA